ncbi:hypothetical protein [Seonamhaeicola sp.]|uniref:hypothetical protein n=1 Tax=Seonamhaeicola sp. TaxID=1912245 RepID=UPI00262D53A8|nr:hypothetical protein [Seonamhaeicola sp.]
MKKYNIINKGICVQMITLLILFGLAGCNSYSKKGAGNHESPALSGGDTLLIPSRAIRTDLLVEETHPLSDKIKAFLERQPRFNEFMPTDLGKTDYLKIIEGQVRAMLKYQNEEGRIIDPVDKVEKYYTTPCFAHAVGALVASASISIDDHLAKMGIKALDISLTDMVNASVNGDHGDFYTWPVMLAYETYKPYVSSEQLKSWEDKIHAVKIDKLYRTYDNPDENNWVLVHTAGEFLRAKNGFTNFNYVEKMLGIQLKNFTELGMYNEFGNPLAYDLFPRHYLSGMLQLGYKGREVLSFKDKLWKGAWTSLFMQSPVGELPTGYRSSHHIWNEAEQCVVFEIYAAAYAKLGLKKEAGAFKRAAMISLRSMQDWIREDGSGFIVKNRFPIEKRHAYERYSVHTCYNMLAMSMLAQAWQFSDSAVNELPAPADTGGFVLPVLEPFHKVFANSNGTYIEYDTKGDQKYNPTGILRVHVKGGHPQLGPSDGIAQYFGGENNVMALGPLWKDDEGVWVSLAKENNTSPKVTILKENDSTVEFSITHQIRDIKIVETITINNDIITIHNEFIGIQGAKKLAWPILVNDGMKDVQVHLKDQEASLSLDGRGVKLSIISRENIELVRSYEQFDHRNGIMEIVYVKFNEESIAYSLEKSNLIE